MASFASAVLSLLCLWLVYRAVVLGPAFVYVFNDPYAAERFDRARWLADSEGRGRMARDLMERHLRPGTPEAGVAALLGPPGRVIAGQEASGFPGSGAGERKVYEYSIGFLSSGPFPIDPDLLHVAFDARGRLVAARLNRG